MPDDDKPRGLTKGRLFLLIFFGIALLLSITTILATWDEEREGTAPPPSELPSPSATPGN